MPSTLRVIPVLVGLLIIAPSASHVTAEPTTAPAHPDDRTIGDKLDVMLPPVKFDGVGLGDVIDYLHNVYGPNTVKFSVDWKALKAAGVTPTTPVSLNLRNVKFLRTLSVILDNVGAKEKLTYEVDDGVIVITTVRGLVMHLRSYDIRFVFERDKTADRDKIATEVMSLVKDTVDPESWSVEGRSCKIDAKKSELLIAQSHDNLKAIENLLNQLRESMPARASQPATDPFR